MKQKNLCIENENIINKNNTITSDNITNKNKIKVMINDDQMKNAKLIVTMIYKIDKNEDGIQILDKDFLIITKQTSKWLLIK